MDISLGQVCFLATLYTYGSACCATQKFPSLAGSNEGGHLLQSFTGFTATVLLVIHSVCGFRIGCCWERM